MTPFLRSLLRPSRSIAARVMLLVAVGTLTTLCLLGVASWSQLRKAEQSVAREHESVAIVAARQFDDHLAELLSTLQQLANDVRALEPLDAHARELETRMLTTWHAAARLDGLFLATLDGRVQSRAPAGLAVADGYVSQAVAHVQRASRPAVTSLVAAAAGDRRILLLVPLRNWQGDLQGVIVGELDPSGRRFARLATSLAVAPIGQLDLIDADGSLLFSSAPHRTAEPSGDVVASAAVTLAPWRVVSHRIDGMRAPAEQLGSVLLWLAPLLVGGSLLLAWGAAWSVRRPLLALTDAAERLEEGDLTTPVPFTGRDEIGQLGRAFESMRVALETSRREIELVNSALEERVEQRTRELERLNRELRDRERMRQSLLRKVITAQEDERKRIARELHDESCQTVTALGLRLDAALASVPPESEAWSPLTRARELATRCLDELHRLMHALRPALLDDLGLIAAMRRYAERLTRVGVSVRFESAVASLRLPMELETAVFRAVQEALTNIERHAHAEMVLVQVAVDGGVLTIDIEDDGDGFDPGSLTVAHDQGRGLGLMGMRERLELAGGGVEIHSSPGSGTYVAIRLPVPEGAVDAEDSRPDRG